MRDLPELKLDLKNPEKFGNLAKKLDEDVRRGLASDICELVQIDDISMKPWAGKAQGYLDALEAERAAQHVGSSEAAGSGEDAPPSTELTLSAVVQFSARATDALLGEPDLARASEPGGEALAEWISAQLRTKDPNWTLDTDPLIVHMSVTGLGWRKRTFDDVDKLFHTHFVPSVGRNRVIVNDNISSIERAPRVTHEFERYPYEIMRSIKRGHWIDYDPRFDGPDTQAPKRFFEVDLWLDLDGDEAEEPWTLVISRDDQMDIVKIVPRWSKKTITDTAEALFFNPIRRFYPYRFLPDPKGGFFPMGFGRLLSRAENSADQMLAAIINTAKNEAANGGVYGGGGVGMPDKIELQENRITVIPMDGGKITDQLSMFPAKTVSAGSVSVLDKLITLADRLSGSLNLLENAPASMTATLAKGLIDNGTQVQSAVHRRLVASMTQEFRMFAMMADAYGMLPQGLSANDAEGVAVTADPQLATEMHRSALAGVYMELAKDPGMNPQEVRLRLCQTLRLPNPEKLVAPPQPPQATPWEKMQGYIGLQKQQNEKIKVTGAVAVQLTQALKNMVEAAGGMQNNQMALLTMAQLEQTVQQLMQESGNAGSGADGMGQQSGNPALGGPPSQPPGGGSPGLPGGAPGGLPDAGQGGGIS